MEFSAASVWAMTKLFVISPGQAAQRAVQGRWSVQTSLQMIALSAVVSGICAGVIIALLGPEVQVRQLDGSVAVQQRMSPMLTTVISLFGGVAFSLALYVAGRFVGGRGQLDQFLAPMGALQIALAVVSSGVLLISVFVPVIAGIAFIVAMVISVRGLFHCIKAGHGFEGVSNTLVTFVGGVFLLAMVLIFLGSFLGLGGA